MNEKFITRKMEMPIPKYRKKVLYGRLKADVRDIIATLCRYKGVEIIDGAVCLDHVHLSVESIFLDISLK